MLLAFMEVTSSPLPSQGMKVSCTHFQCAAGAFAYLREHFPQAFSVDMSRQILTLNVNLMLVRTRCPAEPKCFCFCFEIGSYSVAQAGLKLDV